MLVHHVVYLPLVQRVGEIAAKDRPQIVVLGGVVASEALSKVAPTFDQFGATIPVLQDVPCFDICHVAQKGVMHGHHEANISTLVV